MTSEGKKFPPKLKTCTSNPTEWGDAFTIHEGKTATSATTYCMQTPYHTTFIILKWRESNQTALSHPSLFQIRSNRPLDPNSCINIVVTAPLPSPKHLTQCQRRDNSQLVHLKVPATWAKWPYRLSLTSSRLPPNLTSHETTLLLGNTTFNRFSVKNEMVFIHAWWWKCRLDLPRRRCYDRFSHKSCWHFLWRVSTGSQRTGISLRGHNKDFLTCVATFCHSGFYEFNMRESTSLQWFMIRFYLHIISKPNVRKSLTDLRGCFISPRNLLISTPTFN